MNSAPVGETFLSGPARRKGPKVKFSNAPQHSADHCGATAGLQAGIGSQTAQHISQKGERGGTFPCDVVSTHRGWLWKLQEEHFPGACLTLPDGRIAPS